MIKRRKKTTSSRSANSRFARGNNKWFIISIFVIAQLVFLTSPLFQLKSVDIVGESSLTQSYMFQGLNNLVGKNIFMIRFADIKTQFKNIFWIKDISISYTFPGKLKVILNKRNPVALASNVKDKIWYEVTSDGSIMGVAAENSPLFKIVTQDEVKTGQKLGVEKLIGARDIEKSLPENVKSSLNYIMAEASGGYTLNGAFLGYDFDIKMGDARNLPYKIELLSRILEKLAGIKSKVSYIDLRYAQPVVKIRN